MKNKEYKLFAIPYAVWMLFFVIIPIFIIGYYGVTDRFGNFTLENVFAITQYEHYKSLFLAIYLAIICTIICLLIAYPLALILRKFDAKLSGTLIFIFLLPMWMNMLLRTLAWQTLLERKGVINAFLTVAHLPTLNIINTNAAVVLGMVYDFLPFMIMPVYNSLVKIDDSIIDAAGDLGAKYHTILFKIIVPLSIPGIVSGITMVFIPALTTFVISNILGGGRILLIGGLIEQEFMHASNWNLGSGLSIFLIILVFAFIALSMRFEDSDEIV